MTDLLTRIRAYVAAIPTHQCQYCDEKFTPMPDQNWCPNCESIKVANCMGYKETQADALLREVAALEPVSYARVHDKRSPHFGDVVLPDSQESEMWAYDLIPLYTLTGATHE